MQPKRKRSPGRPHAEPIAAPMREQILQSAAQLFMRFGYEGVSIQSVADDCGVTKATVYYYFPTKSDLFTSTIVRMLGNVKTRILSILELPEPLQARLIRIAEQYLNVPHFDMDIMLAKAAEAMTPEQTQAMREAEAAIYRVVVDAFDAAARAGEIRDVDPAVAGHAYIAVMRIGNTRYAEEKPLFASTSAAARAIVELIWQGVGR
ncbi:TetR/AcrR family transcriptional regulator [Paenibacillus cymbidii]|uniref:TetR/AcrR family transcriptional regulator n=1 Tax=Paenibacillus cymbidii TaxID=1639034 RepID=UPI001436C9A7|nr:TetR/AcrR family transcriptional regulator [Paenibacillus cymbidii]